MSTAASNGVLDRVWDGAGDAWQWLRGVILGEWQDNRSIGQIVTDALAGFIPGVGSVITLRDLIAVIVRLAKHPEKREEVDEWILLIAMLLPLIITIIGAAAAGVGALVGAELGAFLRATALFVVKKGGVAIKAIVEFFQAHGYGHVVKALQEVKFAKYQDDLIKGLNQQIDKLIELTRNFQNRLKALSPQSLPSWLPGREAAINAIAHCSQFIQQLTALRRSAVNMIPRALIEMDQRLGALLAGELKLATQTTHSVRTGVEAPRVERLEARVHAPAPAPAATAAPAQATNSARPAGAAARPPSPRPINARSPTPATERVLKNPKPPEPGNTRRTPERRTLALVGKREFAVVDKTGRPVGAKPYKAGETVMEHPAVEREDWLAIGRPRVDEGWPQMHQEYLPGKWSNDYNTFSGELRASSLAAGSPDKLKRVVSHDAVASTDAGAFWNRELPLGGADLRAGSAVKDSWNHNGKFVELTVPPAGDPVWRELNALQSKAAGKPVPYAEELKFWEGPASSQVYKKEVDSKWVDDDWYLGGGKPQQFFDREQMALLGKRGFVSERKPTNFKDYDPEAANATGGKGNIVPNDGPYLEVVPKDQAVKPAKDKQ